MTIVLVVRTEMPLMLVGVASWLVLDSVTVPQFAMIAGALLVVLRVLGTIVTHHHFVLERVPPFVVMSVL